jgi:hypothetical protein
MSNFNRRHFLTLLTALPLASAAGQQQDYQNKAAAGACWLDVCAPLVVEDAALGVSSEIVVTSDTFSGPAGHADGRDKTDYEIYLYDRAGQSLGKDGVAARLTVPAMQTTVIKTRDLLNGRANFWGGMRLRLRPNGRETMHASDLFSSAFVRWQTAASFDNVHANPDPLQLQKAGAFYYSMPFPSLAEYECLFSLFNPYATPGAGRVTLYGRDGRSLREVAYELPPRASLLLNVNQGELVNDVNAIFGPPPKPRKVPPVTFSGGTIGVTNAAETTKTFGYLLIRRAGQPRFSVEHPIHQSVFAQKPTARPFNADGKFAAKNILFTPLLFRSKSIGGITLESRFHFSTGLPLEETMWLSPFATDAEGRVAWSTADQKTSQAVAPTPLEQGALRLVTNHTCVLEAARLSLPDNFSGGLSLAVTPDCNHTLMKVELRVPEWGAHAFTHFRPGLRSAQAYQRPQQRGGLGTDYITSGARFVRKGREILHDELLGVINITAQPGQPVLEIFGPRGLLTRVPLGDVPGFAARHFLLSEWAQEISSEGALTLRLVDEKATLLMSVVHLDYLRRDLALDHGSDRFSTFLDYGCA